MIDRFSQKYSLHPDIVFKNTTFDTVTAFLIKWNEEAQYADRYSQVEKMLNAT